MTGARAIATVAGVAGVPNPYEHDLELERRVLPLEGAQNFRDLGGYPAADGREVRWGQLFRSDGLATLTSADRGILAALGLGLVCDLRSDDEVEEEPNRLPEGVTYRRFPVQDGAMQPRLIRARIEAGDIDGFDDDFMAEGYRGMLANRAQLFADAFLSLAAPDAPPAVFHCTAGKDRTGVLSALLLLALGVPEEMVVADYALTEACTRRRIEAVRLVVRLRGGDPDAIASLLGSRPAVMERTLVHLRETYGGAHRYLVDKAGASEEAITTLRTRLLTTG